jgi:hypothetical protein
MRSPASFIHTGRFGGFIVSEATATAAPAKRKSGGQSPLFLAMLPLLVLFIVAAVLFWLSTKDAAGTYRYWEYFVPVVALISLISGWGQSYLSGELRLWYIVKQLLHWGGLVAIIYVLGTQGVREAVGDHQYTSLLLYLLAFTALLAAIHMDLKLLFFAAFLVFCGYLFAVPADNPALVWIGESFGIAEAQTKPVIISVGVAVCGFIASLFIMMMLRGMLMTKRVADKRKEATA